MKKIFLTLLLFSFIHFDIYGETHSIALTYDISPTYTVTIPKEVDISTIDISFHLSVSGDIYKDSYLEVLFDDTCTISNGVDEAIVSVSQDKTTFSYEEVINTTTATVNLTHQELKAGEYTGQLNMSISLKEGA